MARAIGRPAVQKPYLGRLRNHVTNLQRLGRVDSDIADGGSDALIDALVAHGEADAVAARLDEHLAAGADHVCAQVRTARGVARHRSCGGWPRCSGSAGPPVTNAAGHER